MHIIMLISIWQAKPFIKIRHLFDKYSTKCQTHIIHSHTLSRIVNDNYQLTHWVGVNDNYQNKYPTNIRWTLYTRTKLKKKKSRGIRRSQSRRVVALLLFFFLFFFLFLVQLAEVRLKSLSLETKSFNGVRDIFLIIVYSIHGTFLYRSDRLKQLGTMATTTGSCQLQAFQTCL